MPAVFSVLKRFHQILFRVDSNQNTYQLCLADLKQSPETQTNATLFPLIA